MEIHHKQFFNGINLNGNTFSRIGNIGAIDSAGSLKYDNGALCYHNGTSWVSLGGGAKYMGELPEAVLPQGAQDGEVYRVMCNVYDRIPALTYPAGTWRSFTSAEIKYIVHQRTNEGSLKCFCVIDGQYKGLMLFPDDFANETSIAFNWNAESAGGHYSDNQFTIQQFRQLESEGAVLFPCAAFPNRAWTEARCIGSHIYWTGSRLGQAYVSACVTWYDDYANDPTYNTTSSSDFLRCDDNWQSLNPFAVRLIQVVGDNEKAFGITLGGNSYYVKFAPANLQYNCQAHKFRFAKNQYDACTLDQNGRAEWVAQTNVTLTGNRWVDVMGYGSSGYNANWTPASRTNNQYAAPTNNLLNTNWDWGTYNQIGGWTEGVYPAGSVFVVDNGELVPLCAGVPLDIYTQLPNIADKAVKVSGATNGNFAGLDASGNLTDSGVSPADISGNSNYTIHAPLAAMTTDTPILLGTEFGDIADAIEQGKNPIVVFAQQDSTDTIIFAKINDYMRMSMVQIPDGQGGTLIPADAISFYTTLNVIGTATSWFIIFVNPSDNETYIYHDTVLLPNILWDNDSAIYQAWGDNNEKAIDVKIDGVTIKKENDGTLYSEGAGVNYLLTVYPTDLHTQNEEIWIPNQATRTELLFDTVEAQYISGKVPTAVYAVVNGDGTDQQRIGLSLTDFEYHGRPISLDRYYQMDLHYGEIQTKGAFIFKSNKMFVTPLERMVMYLYKGVDDNTYIYMGIENGAVMDIQYEGTWSSSYDPSTSAYAYGMNTIKVANRQFNLQQEPNSGVDAINRIYQLAIQYKNSSFRFIYGNEEVISNTYYITLNNDIITVYINEWDSQQQAFVQKSAEAPLQALATATN